MTDKEIMQMTLQIMESAIKAGDWVVDGACDPDWALNALRAALAQPEREWVGLTDNEVMVLNRQSYDAQIGLLPLTFYRAIEAKLKEKNGY